jgi:regulator of protease activity HflC (stomatin/prohibitin superfamily)
MYKRIRIRTNEIGLRLRAGELRGVLQPGIHWVSVLSEVRVYDRLMIRFEDRRLEVLLKSEELRDHLVVADLNDRQRALVYRNGRLAFIVGPGLHAFWNDPCSVAIEVFDIASVRFEHPQIEQILAWSTADKFLQAVRAESFETVLVYVDGDLYETFGPGTFAYWIGSGKVTWKSIDLREQVIDVAGQEIMTADKVTLRLNLLVSYQVTDAVRSVSVVDDARQVIYREAQLALRAAVGGRILDRLLTDKENVANEVRQFVQRRAKQFGVEVQSVGIRDVILPGDMKIILNQVIEAEKRAEANVIRRREETAAARSQANTARILADNPVLQRMKELEHLQEILAGTKATFVFGQGDLSEQVRGLITSLES